MNDAATTDGTETVTYEKGSWQDSMQKSSTLLDRSTKAKKTASNLLWSGTQGAIETWLPSADSDVSAEGLYDEVKEALGEARKGDASKIKTVALAVANHGLDLSSHKNLSQAYSAARALTVVADQHAAEDDTLAKAVENIDAPKTTGSVEGAASLLLSKGIEGAVVAILDALGPQNFDAHKALVREFSTEIAARVQAAKPKPAPKAPAKPKGTAKKAAASPKATVSSAKSKGKPVGAAKKAVAKPVQPEPVVEPDIEDSTVEDADLGDMFDEIEGEEEQVVETPAPAPVPAPKSAGGKGRPVVRRPARKA